MSSRHTHSPSHPGPDHGHGPGHIHDKGHGQGHEHANCHGAARSACLNAEQAVPLAGATQIHIQQMDCPTEEALIRAALARLPGVGAMRFDLIKRVLSVVHPSDQLQPILTAIRHLGYDPIVREQGEAADPLAPAPGAPLWPLWVAGALALAAEGAHWMGAPHSAGAVLALAAIALCGLSTYKKGWLAIRHGLFNINALMSVAVTGALLIGQWAEAAMVMVLFTLAERIEAKSLDRARQAIAGLMTLAPDEVLTRMDDGSWRAVDAKTVQPGAQVLVKPGARIGLDGIVTAGESTVDQSPITGESIPVGKVAGESVYAGTINGAGSLEFRVTQPRSQSTLARIVQIVEQAQGERAPTQRFVDRFASVYTPAVIVLSILVALVGPLLTGGPWIDWIYKALVLLVIACPCALVISTPVTVVSGLARAARMGILVKGGVYLENGRLLKAIALDKTGTLTTGRAVQTDCLVFGPDILPVQRAAAALAAESTHPVSQAIARAAVASSVGQTLPRLQVHAVQERAGEGVQGDIDSLRYYLGNARLARSVGPVSPTVMRQAEALEQAGHTVVYFGTADGVLALFAVADTLKPESAEAVRTLTRMGIETVMLTGDNAHIARAIADQAGVTSVRSEQLPQDKMAVIDEMSRSRAVGMVGDGINDTPALARADIGFVMGGVGTDAAMQTADVAIMDDDLRKIPSFLALSVATHRILMQNIGLALAIKAVFLVWTIAGSATMWMAVFADVGASLLVIGNGLRLMRTRLEKARPGSVQ